ncbi:MAG: DUF4388 domain-containing protein [Candidatus Sericytochromatia bacterium]
MINKGSLKDFRLFDLLTILDQSKKSGILTLKLREFIGNIYVTDGSVIEVKTSHLHGEDAFYELMFYESGEFEFLEGEKFEGSKNIEKSTHELLEEGNFRVTLTNSLIKNSINTDLKSKIIIVDEKEDDFITMIKSGFDTIISLARESKVSPNEFSQHLEFLIKNNNIEIEKNIQNEIWSSFQKLVNTTYKEFTSISGIKMNKELDKKIQELIEINSLNLEFKDGKIDTKDLFKLTSNEQINIYKLFLKELKAYVVKIYGKDFIINIFASVSGVDSKTIDLLNIEV